MDVNTLAFKIVQQSIGEEPIKPKKPANAQRGKRRASLLTAEERKAIAKQAAQARWEPKK